MGGKLALGTAQFGLGYGIAEAARRVPESEACALLRLAYAHGIRMLDTAAAYGESEAVLGRCLAAGKEHFDIVTKTLPGADGASVARAFAASLERLGCGSLYGVLVHHAADLLRPGGDRLYDQLAEWRSRGQARKLGVSVYTRAEVDAVLERYRLDIVQLPLSVFDQRLAADGTLKKLKRMNVEVHARSVFLQGLALMEPAAVPLERARPMIVRWRAALASRGVSPLAAALWYVARLAEVDRVVVGVHSAAQLVECIAAFDEPPVELDFSGFACPDDELVDPRRWI